MPKSIGKLAGRWALRRYLSRSELSSKLFLVQFEFPPSQDLHCGHLVNMTPPQKEGRKTQVEPKLK